MKKANKKPTRAQMESKGTAPATFRCTCGMTFTSAYALKAHKGDTGHGR